jgi:class 3 adenylate cyclase
MTRDNPWQRISKLGSVEGATGIEYRRTRLTNQYSVLTLVVTATFVLTYALAGTQFLPILLVNAACFAVAVGAIVANARQHRLAARYLLLGAVTIATLSALLLLGARSGFVDYLFIGAVGTFILFDRSQWFMRAAVTAVSAAGIVALAVWVPPDGLLRIPIRPEVAAGAQAISGLVVLALLALAVNLFMGDTALAEARAAQALARSEELLLNILPLSISERLKGDHHAIADGFAEVSVLFGDIVGFTELAGHLEPAAVVAMLNRVFSAFDELSERFGLEKIKTIGDAYMVAAGLPEPRPDHAEAIARMALAMQHALGEINAAEGYSLRLRIGIHTGPVVAGVIGRRKFIYDLWGDTVNVASRMESSGVPGRIQASRETFQRLETQFQWEARGPVAVKGKGEMETYLLVGPAPAAGQT